MAHVICIKLLEPCVAGIAQTPSHTTVTTVIKMRTKRHRVDLASQLLICVRCGGRTSIGLGYASFRDLRPSRAWLKIQLAVIHPPPTITALLGLEIYPFPASLYLAQLCF